MLPFDPIVIYWASIMYKIWQHRYWLLSVGSYICLGSPGTEVLKFSGFHYISVMPSASAQYCLRIFTWLFHFSNCLFCFLFVTMLSFPWIQVLWSQALISSESPGMFLKGPIEFFKQDIGHVWKVLQMKKLYNIYLWS